MKARTLVVSFEVRDCLWPTQDVKMLVLDRFNESGPINDGRGIAAQIQIRVAQPSKPAKKARKAK